MHRCLLAFIVALIPLNFAHAGDQETDLFALISARNLDGLEAAIEQGANVQVRQSEGLEATPLMWATGVEDPRFVEVLIAAGAEVNARDKMGDPAINWAAYYGRVPAIARLLEAGADTHLTGHGDAVEIVMRRGHQGALALLLKHRNTVLDRSVLEAAIEASAIAGDSEAINTLATFTDISKARDWAGRPVLQAAARANQPTSIETLVKAGAPVDAVDSIGFTALFEAARQGSDQAVVALLEAGADPNHVAAANALSLTPLHLAATAGNVEVMNLLIEAGANLNATGTMGATPLLWAEFEGHKATALALIAAGANTGIAGKFGDTARSVAQSQGWEEVVAAIDAQAAE